MRRRGAGRARRRRRGRVVSTPVADQAEARRLRFPGSPTIRVAGRDRSREPRSWSSSASADARIPAPEDPVACPPTSCCGRLSYGPRPTPPRWRVAGGQRRHGRRSSASGDRYGAEPRSPRCRGPALRGGGRCRAPGARRRPGTRQRLLRAAGFHRPRARLRRLRRHRHPRQGTGGRPLSPSARLRPRLPRRPAVPGRLVRRRLLELALLHGARRAARGPDRGRPPRARPGGLQVYTAARPPTPTAAPACPRRRHDEAGGFVVHFFSRVLVERRLAASSSSRWPRRGGRPAAPALPRDPAPTRATPPTRVRPLATRAPPGPPHWPARSRLRRIGLPTGTSSRTRPGEEDER